MSTAEEVNVEVGDGFAALGAVVDHHSETFGEIELFCDGSSGQEEVAEEGLVFDGRLANPWDEFLRDD